MIQLDSAQGSSTGPLVNRLQFPYYLYIDVMTVSFLAPSLLFIEGPVGTDLGPSSHRAGLVHPFGAPHF
jgi:hypothetical protein